MFRAYKVTLQEASSEIAFSTLPLLWNSLEFLESFIAIKFKIHFFIKSKHSSPHKSIFLPKANQFRHVLSIINVTSLMAILTPLKNLSFTLFPSLESYLKNYPLKDANIPLSGRRGHVTSPPPKPPLPLLLQFDSH